MMKKVIVLLMLGVLIFGCLGYIPDAKKKLSEREARLYWANMSPVAFKDYKISTQGATFLIENYGDLKIIIKELNVDGMGGQVSPPNYTLIQGEVKEFTVPDIRCSQKGDEYNLGNGTITIVYSEIGGFSNRVETGEKALVGLCVS